ncbi:MAG: sensor histidine kinase [Roseibacillus sp.]
MKTRPLIAFLLLIILTLGLIAYLGFQMSQSEQTKTNQQLDTLLTQQLNDIDSSFQDQLLTLEQELLQAYDLSLSQPANISSPLVAHSFLLDPANQLIFPAANSPNPSAQAFLARTKSIWESGIQLTGVSESSYPSPPPSLQKAVLGQKASRSTNIVRPDATTRETGWHAWFHDNDVHLLHWMRLSNGQVLGSEINRPAFLARLIGSLPTSTSLPDARIILSSATRQTLYQWGEHTPAEDEAPILALILSPPLETWNLEYYSPSISQSPNKLPHSVLLNLLGLAAAFLVIAFWFYRENNRSLREASRRVSFVNQVSHELKTPLTNIRLYAEMATHDLDDNDHPAAQSLQVVNEETSRLSRLINNVLSFARADRSELQLHPQALDSQNLLTSCLKHWQPSLDLAGITITTELSPNLTILADPDAVEQVIGNLLSNVEKYAADGKSAHLSTQPIGNQLAIDITDQGPGVPRSAHSKIFTPFTRLNSSLTEGVSGTGIGLSIARALAQEMNGDLTLLPSDTGAHFRLLLPLQTNSLDA